MRKTSTLVLFLLFQHFIFAQVPNIQGIIINEILLDPNANDNAGFFDTDGDGIYFDTEDEFIELHNTTGADVNISGWTIGDDEGTYYTFPSNTIIAAGGFLVYMDGYSGTPPSNFVVAGNMGLNNNGEPIFISDGSECIVVRIGTSSISANPCPGSMAITDEESWGVDDDCASTGRSPDGSANIENSQGPPDCLASPGFGNSALPVELSYFTADLKQDIITLAWRTETEANNEAFLVEHSTDGIRYETIARINGAGDALFPIYYNHVHTSPKAGWNYYRLQQVDYDGAASYSAIRSVFIRKENSTSLYPTLASDFINFQYQNDAAQTATALLYSLEGKVITQFLLEPGTTTKSLAIDHLPKGQYILKAIFEQHTTVHRFVKQ